MGFSTSESRIQPFDQDLEATKEKHKVAVGGELEAEWKAHGCCLGKPKDELIQERFLLPNLRVQRVDANLYKAIGQFELPTKLKAGQHVVLLLDWDDDDSKRLENQDKGPWLDRDVPKRFEQRLSELGLRLRLRAQIKEVCNGYLTLQVREDIRFDSTVTDIAGLPDPAVWSICPDISTVAQTRQLEANEQLGSLYELGSVSGKEESSRVSNRRRFLELMVVNGAAGIPPSVDPRTQHALRAKAAHPPHWIKRAPPGYDYDPKFWSRALSRSSSDHREVLDRASIRSLTLVQGPPGTGKSNVVADQVFNMAHVHCQPIPTLENWEAGLLQAHVCSKAAKRSWGTQTWHFSYLRSVFLQAFKDLDGKQLLEVTARNDSAEEYVRSCLEHTGLLADAADSSEKVHQLAQALQTLREELLAQESMRNSMRKKKVNQERDLRILVCADSNTAAYNILGLLDSRRLEDEEGKNGFMVLAVGPTFKVEDQLHKYCLDKRAQGHMLVRDVYKPLEATLPSIVRDANSIKRLTRLSNMCVEKLKTISKELENESEELKQKQRLGAGAGVKKLARWVGNMTPALQSAIKEYTEALLKDRDIGYATMWLDNLKDMMMRIAKCCFLAKAQVVLGTCTAVGEIRNYKDFYEQPDKDFEYMLSRERAVRRMEAQRKEAQGQKAECQEAERRKRGLGAVRKVPDPVHRLLYPIVFLDEAGQASETSSLIPLTFGVEWMMSTGDLEQLPPTLKSLKARQALQSHETGGGSLHGRWRRLGLREVPLTKQYRMHPSLFEFSRKHFYKSTKFGLDNVEAMKLKRPPLDLPESLKWLPLSRDRRTVFVDVEDRVEVDGAAIGTHHVGSKANLEEARVAVDLMIRLAQDRSVTSLAIITPYKAQEEELKERLDSSSKRIAALKAKGKVHPELQYSAGTIDAFQGREADVVIITTVRNNEERNIGHVADRRRLNVAITRARRALVVVGSKATLSEAEGFKGDREVYGAESLELKNYWPDFISHIEEAGGVVGYHKAQKSQSETASKGEGADNAAASTSAAAAPTPAPQSCRDTLMAQAKLSTFSRRRRALHTSRLAAQLVTLGKYSNRCSWFIGLLIGTGAAGSLSREDLFERRGKRVDGGSRLQQTAWLQNLGVRLIGMPMSASYLGCPTC